MKHKLLTIGLSLLLGAGSMMALDFESGVLKYSTDNLYTYNMNYEGNNVAVVGYGFEQDTCNVVVPATVTNAGVTYNVVEIGVDAFRSNTDIQTIDIPSSVRVIRQFAFAWASNLKEVKLHEGLERLDDRAFLLTSLESITLPKSLTFMGDGMVQGTKIKTISFPGNVKFKSGVGTNNTCNSCSLLETATFEEGNTVVPNLTFYNCTSLKTVNLPSTMVQIGFEAFADNAVLQTINCKAVIPPSVVTTSGQETFLNVPSTCVIYVPANSVDAYKSAAGWSGFEIRALDGTQGGGGGSQPSTEFVRPTRFCAPEGAIMWSHAPSLDTKTRKIDQQPGNSSAMYYQHIPAEYKGKYIIGTEWVGWTDENGNAYTSGGDLAQVTNIPCYIDSMRNDDSWSCKSLIFDNMHLTPDGRIVTSVNNGVKVSETGMYVGCGIDIRDPKVQVPVWDIPDVKEESYWGYRSGEGGEKEYIDKSSQGALAYRVYLVDQIPAESYDIALIKPDTIKPVLAGQNFQLQLPLVNCGWRSFSSYKFTYTINGQDITGQGSCRVIMSSWEGKGMFNFGAITEPGTYEVTINLDRVGKNDAANTSQYRTIKFNLTVLSAEAPEIPAGTIVAAYGDGPVVNKSVAFHNYAGENGFAILMDDPTLAGKQIIGVRMPQTVKTGLTDLSIWTSTAKDGSTRENRTAAYVRNGSVVALFDTPVTVPDSGLFVGISMTNISTNFYIYPMWEGMKGVPKTLYYTYQNQENLTPRPDYGALAMEVLMAGDGFEKGSILPKEQTGNTRFAKNKEFNISTALLNYGCDSIRSMDYTVSLGEVTKKGHADFTPAVAPRLLYSSTLKLPMEGMDLLGEVTGKMTIDKVNGEANPYAAEELDLNAIFLNKLPVKRPLMEEGTGTKCGWCPRGMLAMDMLHKMYGEDFIAAAYHRFSTADPMYNDAALPYSGGGYPSAAIDRGATVDPYTGASDSKPMGIIDVYQQAADQAAPASIELATTWNPETQTIGVDAELEFAFMEEGLRYTLGYIVTIDSLSHPEDAAWIQDNYYHDFPEYATDPNLELLRDQKFDINTFNHVVIECSNYKSVKKSIPGDTKAGDIVKNHRDISLADNVLMEDPANVHVICLLLDENNKVKNARQVGLNADTRQSSVENVVAGKNDRSEYYDLMGRRVANPGHGIFIHVTGSKAQKVIL